VPAKSYWCANDAVSEIEALNSASNHPTKNHPQKLKPLPPDQIKSNWCACRKAKEWQTAVRTKLHHILSQLRFTDWLFLY
jgi:hypothetical protein